MRKTKSFLDKFKLGKSYNLISMPQITLTEEEADKFLDYVVDESVMKDYARIIRMKQPQKNVRQIGFGSGRFLYPAAAFNESKYKKQWAHNRIQLQTQELRGAVAVFDSDLEDIRGVTTENQFMDQLMKIIGVKVSNELEEAFWIGDTHGLNGFAADDIRSLWDGWRYIINHSQSTGAAAMQLYLNDVTGSAHIKDACLCESGDGCASGNWDADADFRFAGGIAERSTAAPYDWEFKYHMMLKNMPSKYKQKNGLGNLKFLNSDLVTQDYMEALSARGTALGDSIFTGKMAPAYGKVGILDVPLMATNLIQDGDGTYGLIDDAGGYTDVVLTHKGNFIIGMQRDIKLETQRVPADQATYVFYSMRVAIAIENVDAVVLTRCLTHRC